VRGRRRKTTEKTHYDNNSFLQTLLQKPNKNNSKSEVPETTHQVVL
jgi:hypothetical protein